MKLRHFLPVFLFLTSIFGKAQNIEDSTFIKHYFINVNGIVFRKGLSAHETERIIKALAKDTIVSLYDKQQFHNSILILTQEEKKIINNKLDSLSSNYWYESLRIDSFKALSQDSINVIFEEKPVSGWQFFHKNFGLKLYSFSKPIFFRNNTLCLFYCGYSCDYLCGEGQLSVFRKENGIWISWLILYSWVS